MRRGEILSLTLDQVDLERREIRLSITKTKRPRVFPLSDRAVSIFAAIASERTTGFVFINPTTGKALSERQESVRVSVSESGDHKLPLP